MRAGDAHSGLPTPPSKPHFRSDSFLRQVYKGYMQLRITTHPSNAAIATQRIPQQPQLALVDDAGQPTVSRAAVRRNPGSRVTFSGPRKAQGAAGDPRWTAMATHAAMYPRHAESEAALGWNEWTEGHCRLHSGQGGLLRRNRAIKP
jgi:hypothetical protein